MGLGDVLRLAALARFAQRLGNEVPSAANFLHGAGGHLFWRRHRCRNGHRRRARSRCIFLGSLAGRFLVSSQARSRLLALFGLHPGALGPLACHLVAITLRGGFAFEPLLDRR